MPRASTKLDLIEASNGQFEKLWGIIDSMPQEIQTALFDFGEDFLLKQKQAHWRRDKNLRDVLVHLYEWPQLLLNWVRANRSGEAKPFLPEPYNWRTYARMNVGFWEKHQATPYQQSREMLKKSHEDVMALIETFSGDELFSEGGASYLPGCVLGGYCVSATASHYDWAMKKIKQHIKTQKKPA
jgi:hypothetical protein